MEDKKPLILIVDDVSRNLKLLGSILYDKEYEIAMADSGKEALRILTEVSPDLILLDIMMPEMDGYEVCAELKKKR
jgi:two-component system sensor histidine kinase/response regulator